MKKQQSSQFFFIAAGFLAVIIGVLITVIQTGVFEKTSEVVTDQKPTVSAVSFNYLLPDSWNLKSRAQKAIQSISENQMIEFGVVKDPTNEKIFYFAASKFDLDAQTVLNSVYRYDTNDYTFERIYRRTFSKGDLSGIHEQAFPILHVLGYDNGKLVILAEDYDDSPGPCTEPLVLGRDADDEVREMMSLDLNDPFKKGLESYRLPDSTYEAAIEKQDECLENGP